MRLSILPQFLAYRRHHWRAIDDDDGDDAAMLFVLCAMAALLLYAQAMLRCSASKARRKAAGSPLFRPPSHRHCRLLAPRRAGDHYRRELRRAMMLRCWLAQTARYSMRARLHAQDDISLMVRHISGAPLHAKSCLSADAFQRQARAPQALMREQYRYRARDGPVAMTHFTVASPGAAHARHSQYSPMLLTQERVATYHSRAPRQVRFITIVIAVDALMGDSRHARRRYHRPTFCQRRAMTPSGRGRRRATCTARERHTPPFSGCAALMCARARAPRAELLGSFLGHRWPAARPGRHHITGRVSAGGAHAQLDGRPAGRAAAAEQRAYRRSLASGRAECNGAGQKRHSMALSSRFPPPSRAATSAASHMPSLAWRYRHFAALADAAPGNAIGSMRHATPPAMAAATAVARARTSMDGKYQRSARDAR